MVERSLSMREAPGSIPGLSKFCSLMTCRDDPGWLWGWTSNPLVVDAAEVRFLLPGDRTFCLRVEASARACIGAAWQLNDKAWSPHMPPCLCQERRPKCHTKGQGRPYGCLYKEVYGLLATVINTLSQ